MSRYIKKILLPFLFFMGTAVFAQGITTASAYFKTVSDYYATLRDYEAEVEIRTGREEMSGMVSFKRPNLLRIDFSNPHEQVIVFNGDMLTIYLPGSSVVLQQAVESDSSVGSASLATPQGLALLSRYYVVAYELGQAPVPLENGSDEMVIKLSLTRRSTSEAFRSIKLDVNASTKLIRRVRAETTRGEVFVFNFLEYRINRDIAEQRFIYDPPGAANNYNNFLFSE